MTKSSKQEYIDYQINTAKETLQAARSLAKDGYWNSVINRLYYSCFYAIQALLFKYDISTRSHSGLKHRFSLHFVKSGKIDKNLAGVFIELSDFRQESDYADFIDFNEEETLPLIPRVENLIQRIEDLIY